MNRKYECECSGAPVKSDAEIRQGRNRDGSVRCARCADLEARLNSDFHEPHCDAPEPDPLPKRAGLGWLSIARACDAFFARRGMKPVRFGDYA